MRRAPRRWRRRSSSWRRPPTARTILAQISASLAQVTETKGTLGSLYASANATAQANK